MSETQNVEFKSSWHDDHLKWVCGFANASGGIIFLGKNDKGEVVGVSDYKKLMDDVPNKIKNYLGIIAEVNLHSENLPAGQLCLTQILCCNFINSCCVIKFLVP